MTVTAESTSFTSVHHPSLTKTFTLFSHSFHYHFLLYVLPADGSDVGKAMLITMGVNGAVAQTLPTFIIGTAVQVINMPLVRATITIQDPKSDLKNTWTALVYLYKTRGVSGLFHGLSAGILKTVPKYVTAVAVKDLMEEYLPHGDSKDKTTLLAR